jgi:hypothetical protein
MIQQIFIFKIPQFLFDFSIFVLDPIVEKQVYDE